MCVAINEPRSAGLCRLASCHQRGTEGPLLLAHTGNASRRWRDHARTPNRSNKKGYRSCSRQSSYRASFPPSQRQCGRTTASMWRLLTRSSPGFSARGSMAWCRWGARTERWKCEPERFCGLCVDDHFEFDRTFTRCVRGEPKPPRAALHRANACCGHLLRRASMLAASAEVCRSLGINTHLGKLRLPVR